MSDEIKNPEETTEAVEAPAPAEENAPEAVAETAPVAAPEAAETKTEETVAAATPAPATGEAAASEQRRPPRRDDGGRPRRDYQQKEGQQRMPRFKKKMCRFCHDKSLPIDYKRADILENFITDRGKILPRRITGTCSKHQRDIAREIKRARIIALLPFVEK